MIWVISEVSWDGAQLGHPDTQETEASVGSRGALGVRKRGLLRDAGRYSAAEKAKAVRCLRGVSGVVLLASPGNCTSGPRRTPPDPRVAPLCVLSLQVYIPKTQGIMLHSWAGGVDCGPDSAGIPFLSSRCRAVNTVLCRIVPYLGSCRGLPRCLLCAFPIRWGLRE